MRKITAENLKKPLIFTGWILSLYAGAWFMISLGAAFASFVTATSVISFLIDILMLGSGLFLGSGLYAQGLKDFKAWPMQEITTPLSFRPSIMYSDSINLLRKFDWEILKIISRVLIDKIDPRINTFIEDKKEPSPNQSWFSITDFWNNLTFRGKNAGDYLINEKAGPEMCRTAICSGIHTVVYSLKHYSEIKELEHEEFKEYLKAENLRYQITSFMSSLRFTDVGFFSSIGLSLRNEYDMTQAPQSPTLF